ncbi:MAG: transposase [Verrucomicrobia bacterium]|nr:transposase [Verrucomicrobiota bacterium]
MNLQQSKIVLAERGWSKRRIARELKLDRRTVHRHVAAKAATNPALGSVGVGPPSGAAAAGEPNAASNPGIGSRPGPASGCAPYEASIRAAVESGLTAKRIHQDLRERGFAGGYSAVKLFVSRLRLTVELPHRRMECEPGAEMQFDFGQGAWVRGEARRRRPHLFRAVLSHSRKGYSEVVWRQDTESLPERTRDPR